MHQWQRRAVADGLKAVLPFQGFLRGMVRKIRPYATDPENDEGLLGDALRQIDSLAKTGFRLEDATVVELGTGWKPILPMMYRLCGAKQVVTVDQERLLDRSQFLAALTYIKNNVAKIGAKIGITVPMSYDRIAADGASVEDMLTASNIDYRAPYDFTRLPTYLADIIVSRDVLEHVPERVLQNITFQSRRILRSGGLICHTIDMSDHWEHGDKTISPVNFLQYEGLAWRLTGVNPQSFQNRLRQCEYVRLFARNNFEILSVSGKPNSKALKALPGLKLCAHYKDMAHEELAILGTTIIARQAANPWRLN